MTLRGPRVQTSGARGMEREPVASMANVVLSPRLLSTAALRETKAVICSSAALHSAGEWRIMCNVFN